MVHFTRRRWLSPCRAPGRGTPWKQSWPRLKVEALEDRTLLSTLYALTANNTLLQFDSATPGTITNTATISGLQPSERVAGIDFRPRTGELFALGIVNAGATDTGRIYRLNPLTGAATQVGSVPFATDMPAGTFYGFDFNPTVDRIRVVNTADENLRVNPNNGARADVPTNDTELNPAGSLVDGVAYDRNFDGKLGAAGTTLYALARNGNQLATQGGVNQSPSPNGGLIQPVGPLGVTIGGANGVGFDIEAAGTAGAGTAFAVFTNAATNQTGLYTINLTTGAATLVGPVGNGATALEGLAVVAQDTVVIGTDTGVPGVAEARDGFTGAVKFTRTPYGAFTGGVRVAAGDVNRDSVPDLITGAGPGGGPHVQVFDGVTGNVIRSFFAYTSAFTGGVFVAAGDVNGDGFADIITGVDAGGGPHVKAFSGQDGTELLSFFAYAETFTGGVRVGAADFDLDGDFDVITGAGAGGGPHVRVFDGLTGQQVAGAIGSFFAYAADVTVGVYVAGGDVTGDGRPEVLTGAGAGGGPHVKAFSSPNAAEVASFFAYEATFTGGARVGVADFNRDGRYEIRTAPGSGRAREVRAFDGLTLAQLDSFFVAVAGTTGLFVGGVRV